jgi:Spy/CpxP family protein refolding chaperone
MRWIDPTRFIAPVLVGSAVMIGCEGSSSSTPPPVTPAASAAPETPPPAVAATQAPLPTAAPTAAPVAEAPAANPQEDEETASEIVEHHRHHHRGGIVSFIAMSLDTIGGNDDQKAAIEKIQTALRVKLEPARVADQKLATVLADGIAAGSIDKAKVDAAIAKLAEASKGVHAAIADSLNELHGVLDDAERVALVDKVEAHWQVWKDANEEGAKAGEPRDHGRIEVLTQALSLTSDQVDKIRDAIRKAPAARHFDEDKVTAHITAFGTAFEAPTFDAKKVTGGDTINANLTSWGATSMAHFYEAILPVLTPDQRTKLAERVREHANHDDAASTAG